MVQEDRDEELFKVVQSVASRGKSGQQIMHARTSSSFADKVYLGVTQ